VKIRNEEIQNAIAVRRHTIQTNENELQKSINTLHKTSKKYNFKISQMKTTVMAFRRKYSI